MMARLFCYMMAMVMAMLAVPVRAEDGYDLWLRYAPAEQARAADISAHARTIVPVENGSTMEVATRELQRAVAHMTGSAPTLATTPTAGALWLATPRSAPGIPLSLKELGAEGFVVVATTQGPDRVDKGQAGEFVPCRAEIADSMLVRRAQEIDAGIADEEHVFQLEKWVAFGDRFSLEDIDDRARDRFRSEGVDERGFVDDRATGAIDQVSILFHFFQGRFVDQVMC